MSQVFWECIIAVGLSIDNSPTTKLYTIALNKPLYIGLQYDKFWHMQYIGLLYVLCKKVTVF